MRFCFPRLRQASARQISICQAALLVVPALLCACTGKDPYNPGTSLGTFTVEAQRKTATCGELESPPDPWRFEVRLAQDGRTLYWLQGGLPVSGTLDDAQRTQMKSSDTKTVREANRGQAACGVRREDQLDAALTAKEGANGKLEVSSFVGTLRYRFVPTEGSDCQDVVALGGYAELPCEVALELRGTPKAK